MTQIVHEDVQLIGITGLARCGKSTLAHHLKNEYGYQSISFAAALKQMLGELLCVGTNALDQMKNDVVPGLGVTVRYMMQTLGTDWGRNLIHPDIWVREAATDVQLAQQYGSYRFIFDDVRFDNEAKFIRDQGGIIVQVLRDTDEPAMKHASENGISENLIHVKVYNCAKIMHLNYAGDYVHYNYQSILEEMKCKRVLPYFLNKDLQTKCTPRD